MTLKSRYEQERLEAVAAERRAEANDGIRQIARWLAPVLLAVKDERFVDAARLYDDLPNGVVPVRAEFHRIIRERYGVDGATEVWGRMRSARVMVDAEYRKIRARQNAEAQIKAGRP